MKQYVAMALSAFVGVFIVAEATGASAVVVCVVAYTAAVVAFAPSLVAAAGAYVESERRLARRQDAAEERERDREDRGFE